MKIGFRVVDRNPASLDGPEALLLPVASDRRPLPGLAGLCDWLQCGALSRLLNEEQFTGARGEQLLLPGGQHIAAEFLLLFGVGRSELLSPADLVSVFREVSGTLSQGRVRKIGFSMEDFAQLARASREEAVAASIAGWVLNGEVHWWLADERRHASDLALELGRIANRYEDLELVAES